MDDLGWWVLREEKDSEGLSAAIGGWGRVPGDSEDLTGQGFIGCGNEHPHTAQLPLRFLPTGIVRGDGRPQAVTDQQPDYQFRLDAAAHDRDRYRRAVHELTSSVPHGHDRHRPSSPRPVR